MLATDNPIEYEGTYPLPEAQLDRFAIRLELRYLSEQEEASMLRRRLDRGSAEPTVHQVVDAHDLLAMRESVEQVTVHDDVLRYVVSLATATRQHPQVAVGASPRAELDLVQLARARALLLGRDYVIPEDVKSLAVPTMAHRISLRPEMWVRRVHGSDVVEELLRRLPVPTRPRADGVIESRSTEVELRWRPSPLTRAVVTCAAAALAVAVIGGYWQLVAFAAPLVGVLVSIGWQRHGAEGSRARRARLSAVLRVRGIPAGRVGRRRNRRRGRGSHARGRRRHAARNASSRLPGSGRRSPSPPTSGAGIRSWPA